MLDDDGLNAYNVKAKMFENGKYYVAAEIPHVAHLLDKLSDC